MERDRLRGSGRASRLRAPRLQPPRPVGGGRRTDRATSKSNSMTTERSDPEQTPRAIDGRAPDVFRPGGWVPMRQYGEDEAVDFVIVGTGAGGATLSAKLAEAGFGVVALDAGAFWRPLED